MSHKDQPTDPEADARAEARAQRTAQVHGYLEALPTAELIAYILDLAQRFPDVRRDLVLRSAEASHDAADHERGAKIAAAEQAHDWSTLAALRAEAFVASPSVESLEALLSAADKAGCGTQVRTAALQYLETGKHAALSASGASSKNLRRSKNKAKKRGPRLDVLLEWAMKEGRHEDVIRWYERLTTSAPPVAEAYRARVTEFLSASFGKGRRATDR